MTEINRQ